MARISAPECQWSDTDYLLNRIEYVTRVLAWQRSADAKHGRNKPKPQPTPADEARMKRKLERTDMAEIARKLNLKEVNHAGN